ncbi:dienelactone hydrolase family protein [Nocardioides sp.]|uniref:dienelactone hydrolase family protein n=1 Tax=Nocardioides sp. TaxID=35761 RepID=UPI002ED112C0
MTDIVLFHHIQGLTSGVHDFADRLRAAGHTVHTPDTFEGRTFASIDEGQAYCSELGFDKVAARSVELAADLPASVFAGFSLGAMPAQQLAQTQAGARALLAYHGFADPAYFDGWPDGVKAQIHAMDHDPFFIGDGEDEEGDIEPAQAFVAAHSDAELFLYPGSAHLFTDSSLSDYDAGATELVLERSLAFLATLEG